MGLSVVRHYESMKRRRMIQSVLGVSAATALPHPMLAQRPRPEYSQASSTEEEMPKLALSVPEQVAGGVRHFFDPASLAALRRLGDIIVPGRENVPGAVDAEAAEFLDFLISKSPADRQ